MNSNISSICSSLLAKLIDPNPFNRYNADDCLNHPWINSEKKEIPLNYREEFNLKIESMNLFAKAQKALLALVLLSEK